MPDGRSPRAGGRTISRRALTLALAALPVLVALALVATLPLGSSDATAATSEPTPNVVVIQTDDQTVESMRVMPKVENLLAQQGTTFTNEYATTPICCPSRATYMSGQYAHNHGVLTNSGGYAKFDHSNSLAPWLRDAGYATVHIGKYMNGYGKDDPTTIPPGWTEWYGAPGGSSYRYFNYKLNENGSIVSYGTEDDQYQTDVYARKAVDVIDRRAPDNAPFFLSVNTGAPHTEHKNPDAARDPRPAPRHRGTFEQEPIPKPPSFNEKNVSDKPEFIREERHQFDESGIQKIKLRYRSRLESLLAVDDAVERIVQALDESGELDNTLILFTSDNGFFGGEHRLVTGKDEVYEEATRVPLVVRGPGVPSGVERDQLTGNIDLAPTILDAADADAGRVIDGRSLLPLAADASKAGGRDLVLESTRYSAIRARDFVYVKYETGERELYDLREDPFQLKSQHDDGDYRDIRRDLADRLDELKDCAGAACR